MANKVRVRMAPSPTGFLHIGSLRTALYDFLFARKERGVFILRVEDTDRARLVPGALENIVQTLTEFGLAPDEGYIWQDGKIIERGDHGPYLQSERLDLYKKYADELVVKKLAYHCFCTTERLEQLRLSQQAQKHAPKYDKLCATLTDEEVKVRLEKGESSVIRLNVPKDKVVKYDDMVFGHIEISSNEVDDQVLIKSDGYPTYHFAVVIDDHLMEISHVMRGDEYISSTPKDILLYEALGWEKPSFVHLPPVISKTTKKKLSKREGDVSVKSFVEKGYLPEAILNFLVFLGWNPKTEQEIFSLPEMIEQFSLDKLNKAGAVFDPDKLDWFNGQYIRKMDPTALAEHCVPYFEQSGVDVKSFPIEFVHKVLLLEKDRLKKFSEIGERVFYFFHEPEYDPSLLAWKDTPRETIKANLSKFATFLARISESDFTKEHLELESKKFIDENGLKNGEVLWPVRVALSGLKASPGPFEIMDAFGILPSGKSLAIARIKRAESSL